VDVSQRVGDRPADPGGLGRRKSRASGALRECHTVDELHHDERDAGIGSGVEDRHDVGVL